MAAATRAHSTSASNVIALDVAAVLRLARASTDLKARVDTFLTASGAQIDPAHHDLRTSLIAFLDWMDGDTDLEPTLGFLMPGQIDEAEGCSGHDEDSEYEDEREPDPQDADAVEWDGETVHQYA